MKKLVLKNSFFAVVLAVLMFFILMPTQSSAQTDNLGMTINGQLNGYVYSFDVSGYDAVTDAIHVRAFTEVTTTGELNEEVLNDAVTVEGNIAYVDFSGIWDLFPDATLVTCSIDYTVTAVDEQGEQVVYDYLDYVVFNKIDVVENVDTAAAEDTTFEYGIDSVMTANLGDVDADYIVDQISENNYDDVYLYALDYLKDKTDLIAANEEAKNTFVWVNNKVVMTKGSTTASGSVVLAAMASQLLKTAGFEEGTNIAALINSITLNSESPYYTQSKETIAKLQKLVTLLPIGVNIKETAVSTGQYAVSSNQYGLTLTPFADYFTGNSDSLTDIYDAFFYSKRTGESVIFDKNGDFHANTKRGLALLVDYLKDSGIIEKRITEDDEVYTVVNLSNCFSLINFKSETPQEFITGFNTTFNGVINSAVAAINASDLKDNRLVKHFMEEKGLEDVASTIVWMAANSSKDIKLNKGIVSTLKELANEFAPQALAAFDSFAADSATKLAAADEMTFNHGINTGDSNNFVLWAVMLVMALIGAAGVALKRN